MQKQYITKIKDWPQTSHGEWVLLECKNLLKKHDVENIERFFETKHDAFGGMSAVVHVQHMVEIGNAESYTDAWREVLGTLKRIFE